MHTQEEARESEQVQAESKRQEAARLKQQQVGLSAHPAQYSMKYRYCMKHASRISFSNARLKQPSGRRRRRRGASVRKRF
jgi:hypothetical protein